MSKQTEALKLTLDFISAEWGFGGTTNIEPSKIVRMLEEALAEQPAQQQEPVATNAPSISNEHIKACAKVAGLIGNWSTAEVDERIAGFARVLLCNQAVQEAFLKANAHLLYTSHSTPRQNLLCQSASR